MIDGGPLRTSRPTGRQVEYRDEPVRYQPEEPERIEPAAPVQQAKRPLRQAEPRQEESVPTSQAKTPRDLSWIKWVVFVVVLAAIGGLGWFFWPNDRSVEATIDTDAYQAVFLSNGQVYFGRLSIVDSDYMKLTSVYYLERQLTADGSTESEEPASEDETTTQTGDNNFQLLKYSDVLYGSEDAMVISRDDIIRYENLRSDGVVAKAIANRS